MIRLKVPAIFNNLEVEVEGRYYPGYESSIVKNFGDNEDKFIVIRAYINGKRLKLSEEDIEELSEDLIDVARERFSEIEDDFVALEENEEDEEGLFILEDEEID